MAEKEKVFSSTIKYNGIFSFKDFYSFCHDWLEEEPGFSVSEGKYEEKLKGDSKDIVVEWKGTKKVTDYFKFEITVKFTITALKEVEVTQDGVKVKTNQGGVKIDISGTLIRDYQGKFETTPFNKFLRAAYEKWIIPSRIGQYEDKLAGSCDNFLQQAKAYLALEAKK